MHNVAGSADWMAKTRSIKMDLLNSCVVVSDSDYDWLHVINDTSRKKTL